MRLNDKSVREPLPVKGRDYQIFDTEVRGFAVCIYRSGSRAFTLDYRFAGRQRRITVGRWPEWTVTAARDRARQLRREIDEGGDLRHTFASLLVSGGASLEMIGKLLGHTQMQTTQRYAHLMDSPLRAGVDAVAHIFRPRPTLVHDADSDRKQA
jgi:integrase